MDTSDSTTGCLIERQRALRSAWRILAPSGLSAEKSGIAETGRALSKDLAALVDREDSPERIADTLSMEARFDALEAEISELAFKVPIAQLRTTLPQQVSRDRRGVLDLLDLMLAPEIHGRAGTEDRIPSIDYVIHVSVYVGRARNRGSDSTDAQIAPVERTLEFRLRPPAARDRSRVLRRRRSVRGLQRRATAAH